MTVWELVQKLTAPGIDPQAHVQVHGEEWDWTENFTVINFQAGRVQVVRMEAT